MRNSDEKGKQNKSKNNLIETTARRAQFANALKEKNLI